ncbi:MAG: gephyrin-like molybdotransferase Glp [Bryobacteraceae bacterium]|jgi:molybdopterin molybdotransferase
MSFEQARACVLEKVASLRAIPAAVEVSLDDAEGRVIAESIAADRDYPPAARSVRDGFAVRAADTPGRLRLIGEARAGGPFTGQVSAGEAVEIMTGATMPAGADAVVMIEHARREGEFVVASAVEAGKSVSPQGEDARCGEELIPCGRRLGFVEIAALASAGRAAVRVFEKPRVALLATGDEIVDVAAVPAPHQVRNSNAHSLAAQVRRAGGVAEILPVARDERAATQALMERGLAADLLLVSGGVSAGKYDLVEDVLAALDAEFYFDRVSIQPGQPLVFGRARGTFFFGLPGNPASTLVAFAVFARAALELLGGQTESALPMPFARLAADFRHKPGLTRFVPARLSADGTEVAPVAWHGSSDVPALARANAFLVADAGRESWRAGEWIRVLLL